MPSSHMDFRWIFHELISLQQPSSTDTRASNAPVSLHLLPMIARRRRTNSNSENDSHPQSGSSRTHASPTEGVSYSGVPNGQAVAPPPQTYVPPPRISADMKCRDRSNEFATIVKSLQSRQVGNGSLPSKSKALQHRSEFMQIAKKIGHDISNTFAKLEKLTI
ncbi:hypothetical protein CAPTEDRAFT_197760, partial [Capitella teleta]